MSIEIIQPIIAWVHNNPGWAEFAAFLIAFAESIALIGLVIPGSVILVAIGTLIGTNVLPLWSTLFAAMLGAILGDTFSYWLGYHFRDHIVTLWPFSKYPKMLKQGEAFFLKHGGKSVFLGRFAGPLRPLIPLIAGMMGMNPMKFLVAATLSGIGWALAYMIPGMVLGVASLSISPHFLTHFVFTLLLVLVVLWLAYWLIQSLLGRLGRKITIVYYNWWNQMEDKWVYKPVKFLLKTNHQKHGQIGLAISFIIVAFAFIFIAIGVEQHNFVIHYNSAIFHFFRSFRMSFLDHIAVALTFLGEVRVMGCLLVGVFIWLVWKSQWRTGFHWLAVGVITGGITGLLKYQLHSARPVANMLTRSHFSFPSAHTAMATACFGFLAMLLSIKEKQRRYACYITAIVIVFFIALSRLYLNAHWLTDVIGSILLGISAILLVTISYRRKPIPDIPAQGIIVSAIVSLVFGWTFLMLHDFHTQLYNYQPYWRTHIVTEQHWWNHPKKHIHFTNRVGKATGHINVQWAGSLKSIHSQLEQYNWRTPQQTKLHDLLRHFSASDYTLITPLWLPFYDDRKPVLELIQQSPDQMALVLEIWRSHVLINGKTPLWYGYLSYYRPTFYELLFSKHIPPTPTQKDAIHILSSNLGQLHWKTIHTHNHNKIILLIKRPQHKGLRNEAKSRSSSISNDSK